VHAVDAWSSVALLREAVDGVDLRGQPHVLKGTRTSWSITPSVIPARRNPEQSAHDPYPVGGLVCLYESVERFVFGALSWANQAAALMGWSTSGILTIPSLLRRPLP
jgi:hypothetical protein